MADHTIRPFADDYIGACAFYQSEGGNVYVLCSHTDLRDNDDGVHYSMFDMRHGASYWTNVAEIDLNQLLDESRFKRMTGTIEIIIDDVPNRPIPLPNLQGYTTRVKPDHVEVGCQTFEHDKINDIMDAVARMRD